MVVGLSEGHSSYRVVVKKVKSKVTVHKQRLVKSTVSIYIFFFKLWPVGAGCVNGWLYSRLSQVTLNNDTKLMTPFYCLDVWEVRAERRQVSKANIWTGCVFFFYQPDFWQHLCRCRALQVLYSVSLQSSESHAEEESAKQSLKATVLNIKNTPSCN